MTYCGACSFSVAFRNGYKLTGKERDTESGLDMFGARYYGKERDAESGLGGKPGTDGTFPIFRPNVGTKPIRTIQNYPEVTANPPDTARFYGR
jgi:hypothetical protein